MKNYSSWNKRKSQLEEKSIDGIYFREREIWWCSVGINIGDEEDGKNDDFERPVLIIKKFNKNIFFGIPLSSQEKENKYYIKLAYENGKGQAMISQMRLFSSKRILRRITALSESEFIKIINEFKKIL